MKVEIWSDVVCPWCYIGKRRFEAALEKFEHRDQVEIVWRSYQLDPTSPKQSDETTTEHLMKKYGLTEQKARGMNEQVSGLAAEEGLEYHLENAKVANTFDAHRLIHLAAHHGLQDQQKERLLKAYFTEGEAVGDLETLVKLGTEIGLDADEVRETLQGSAYTDEVKADIRRARDFGIQGVPFFAIDETYGVSGAQPVEVFEQVLERAWSDSHKRLITVTPGAQGVGSCDGDSCTI
ncbi:DsbA family oxidoreductase [Tengunoibacter tsumagoiensis]|uniref:DSBA oxidoreductase n=1 Tax=Tengunoibacter tsumagoiensis TaxID=2014871 RepID=A0A401ZV79_9CHLR|nr:DsbA family oxidoreductase [Tengunoibacter tsumagoiensis]GCE10747.1 DSBA oxidoreductase [Tengunoibacter tsumagoiensis]